MGKGNAIEIVKRTLSRKALAYWDARLVTEAGTEFSTLEGQVKKCVEARDSGVGVRVLYKDSWGFASTSVLGGKSVTAAAEKAFKMARAVHSSRHFPAALNASEAVSGKARASGKLKCDALSLEEKVKGVLELSKFGRSLDEKVRVCDLAYSDHSIKSVFANSEGAAIEQECQRISLGIEPVAKANGKIQSFHEKIQRVGGLEEIFNGGEARRKIEKAAGKSVELLEARLPRAGKYDLVIDPDLGGVFAHEAVGHPCEGDSIIGHESLFEGRLGEKIAGENVSITDNPLLDWRQNFGYYAFDDEGVKARKHELVKKGVLSEFLLDRQSASRLGLEASGSARAEGYSSPPIVRISNTYFEPGDWGLEELLEEAHNGFLLESSRGGQTDPITGTYQFNTQLTREIKNGELGKSFLPTSFSGKLLETLHGIKGVGDKLEISSGYCGKGGQWVPVGDGSPYLLVSKGLIGGA